MEEHNPFTILFNKLDSLLKSNKKLEKKVDLLLQIVGKVDLSDEFNIKGLKEASKVLGYKSTKTLRNKMDDKGGKLVKNKDYRKVENTKDFFFSKSALLAKKGKI